jgi:hypothetical protein
VKGILVGASEVDSSDLSKSVVIRLVAPSAIGPDLSKDHTPLANIDNGTDVADVRIDSLSMDCHERKVSTG